MNHLIKSFHTICTKKSMTLLLFSIFLCVIIHMWIVQYISNFADGFETIISIARKRNYIKRYSKDAKYVLAWNKNILIAGKEFDNSNLNCSARERTDCLFTTDRSLLYDYMRYDAIVFSEVALSFEDRPTRRAKSQIYIFSSIESSYNKPACELYNDDFFNWTVSYRLDSDIVWSYFLVRNLTGAVVAPSNDVTWESSLSPVSSEIKSILNRKRKAAAWVVSHCRADSLRDEYLTRLQEHLFHFALKIDVYGSCSRYKCEDNDCDRMIRDNYYFYMAFENSLADDYVTEKVLHGYNNYAVPVVYGEANYSRFLPPGSYLNAREIHPYNLAYAMYKAIKDSVLYETYFQWTNLYTIEPSSESQHVLCSICAAVHSPKAIYAPAKKMFRVWWNGLDGMKWCLPEAYWNETSNINLDANHIFRLY